MKKLWACLYLPRLPVEVTSPANPLVKTATSVAVTQGQGAQRWIYCANAAAEQNGVKNGMALTAAYALHPDLQVIPRRRASETEALARVAAWAYQFSGEVALCEPAALFLEIYASARLYGGLTALLEQFNDAVRQLSYTAQTGIAPTPTAARLLAQLNHTTPVTQLHPLPPAIANAAVDVTPLPAKTRQALTGLGAYQIKHLHRLPRAGIARRYGKQTLHYLDRLLGVVPDPVSLFAPPEEFDSCIELPGETDNLDTLRFILRRLLAELAGFLLAKDAGTQRFVLQLHHADHTQTAIPVGLVSPDRDLALFTRLLDERLERVKAPAPIRAVSLACKEHAPYSPDKQDLFDTSSASTEKQHHFFARLRARLGAATVKTLAVIPDHRPEAAWRSQDLLDSNIGDKTKKDSPSAVERPLWLLPEPQLLPAPPEHIVTGPERIEAGWWDNRDITRDYYVAENRNGQRCWVFRNLKDKQNWYLHGYFS